MKNYLKLLILSMLLAIFSVNVSAFTFNGTVYDTAGLPLNNTNVTVIIQNQAMATVDTISAATNASGWFSMSLAANAAYLYQASIYRRNDSGVVDYVGKSLPSFPYMVFSTLSYVNFYLQEAATINITVTNTTGRETEPISFGYQIKDTKLGYTIASSMTNTETSVQIYLPRDRNYSISVYPRNGGTEHFVPVGYEWKNFSTITSSVFDLGLSSYNAETRSLHKRFNVSERFLRIRGVINNSVVSGGWSNITVIPYLLESGEMVFMGQGVLPYNASAWNQGASDEYNATIGTYNISLPFAPAENARYLLFVAANNGSNYYGVFKNITLGTSGINADTDFNFNQLFGLLGDVVTYQLSYSMGGYHNITTKKQTFYLTNATSNAILTQLSAHTEVSVDYSILGVLPFTFMEQTSQSGQAKVSMPLLNVTGIKEASVFSSDYAPKRIPARTISQIAANNNFSLNTFSPQALDGTSGASVSIALYRSNTTCDLPGNENACRLGNDATMAGFSMLPYVVGGGKISFRMGVGSVLVHYVNVDLLASGPPDALFDNNDDVTESAGNGFSKAMRFGSNGPTMYDHILISIPYTEGSDAQTGLSENGVVNLSIPVLYDENWNAVWNTSTNGSLGAALAGNDSHYSASQAQWQTLMRGSVCVASTADFNETNPCYIDKSLNRIWVRVPHFTGTGPDLDGDSINRATTTDTNSGSSGGGGGSASNVGAATVTPIIAGASQSHTWDGIKIGEPAIMNLKSAEIDVKKLEIYVKENVGISSVSVVQAKEKPATIAALDNAYHYYELKGDNIVPKLDKAYIYFDVAKSWLTENNYAEDSVFMSKYADGKWKPLQTWKISASDSKISYKAETNSFSFYAVGAKASVAQPESEEKVTAAATTEPEKTLEEQPPTADYTWIWLILVLMVIAAVMWCFNQPKKRK